MDNFKQFKNTYQKLNQDLSKSKYAPEVYYDGQNVRILANDRQSTGSVHNIKGNSIEFTIPNLSQSSSSPEGFNYIYEIKGIIYTFTTTFDYSSVSSSLNKSTVIGYAIIREKLVLYCTNNKNLPNQTSGDTIWWYDLNTNFLELKYFNHLGFSARNPIEAVGHYENELIQKSYWVDGNHQLRHINLADPDVQNTPVNVINIVPITEFSKIYLNQVIRDTGSFPPGKVGYAYSYANQLGAVTKVGPLSPLYNINSRTTGNSNDITEVIPISFELNIDNVNQDFDYVRVYRVLYTLPDSPPLINLIIDEPITSTSISVIDDGQKFISTVALAEFLLLGTDPFVPHTLAIKDNRLFTANHVYDRFLIDFDSRAYRFDNAQECKIYNSAGSLEQTIDGAAPVWPATATLDAINPSVAAETDSNNVPGITFPDSAVDYNKYVYQADGATIGAEGPNLKISTLLTAMPTHNTSTNEKLGMRYPDSTGSFLNTENILKIGFKRDETYRFGIEFMNEKSQWSFAQWICDFRMPHATTHPLVNQTGSADGDGSFTFDELNQLQISVELNSGALIALGQQGIVGYRIVRVERDFYNRTIQCQGLLGMSIYDGTDFQYGPILGYWGHNGIPFANDDIRVLPYNISTGGVDAIREADGGGTILTREYSKVISEFRSGDLNQSTIPNGYFIAHTAFRVESYAIYEAKSQPGNPLDQDGYPNWSIIGIDQHFRAETIQTAVASQSNGLIRLAPQDNANILNFDRNDVVAGVLKSDVGDVSIDNEWSYQFDDGKDMHSTTNHALVTRLGTSSAFVGSQLGSTIFSYATPAGNFTSNFYLVADFKRFLNSQYGGKSFSERSRNLYIPTSEFVRLDEVGPITLYGDSITTFSRYQRSEARFPDAWDNDTGGKSYLRDIYMFPCEMNFNDDLRQEVNIQSSTSTKARYSTTLDEFFQYNKIYNWYDKINPKSVKPLDYLENNVFDVETKFSNLKVLGENYDSWTQFLTGNSNNVNGVYGPIQRIIENGDILFYFQDYAFGIWNINPNVQTVGDDGTSIFLASGAVLQEYQYKSTNGGCQQKWSISSSEFGLLWYDQKKKKMRAFAQNQKDLNVEGLNVFLNSLPELGNNPILGNGVSSGYYPFTYESYITFKSNDINVTWAYNHLLQTFQQRITLTPAIWIQTFEKMFTVHPYSGDELIPNDTVWKFDSGQHGKFLGANQPSYITVIMNGAPDIVKMLNNLQWNSEAYDGNGNEQFDKTITHIRIWNDYQDTGFVALNADNHSRLLREWRFTVPVLAVAERLRSQYFYVTLYMDNTENLEYVVHDMISSTVLQT